MNLLDLGIIVLLGLITLRGYYRGLFQELAVLVGMVGGVVAAAHTYLRLAPLVQRLISDPQHARWVAFAAVLVTVYWLTRLAAHYLQRLFYHLYLDFLDRLLGGTFALAKGALILGFGLMFLGVFIPKNSRLLKESRTAPTLVQVSRQSLELLPPDFKQRLNDYLKEWQKGPAKTDKNRARQPRPERPGTTSSPSRPPDPAALRPGA
jgi:membrane protein required for colicin V production